MLIVRAYSHQHWLFSITEGSVGSCYADFICTYGTTNLSTDSCFITGIADAKIQVWEACSGVLVACLPPLRPGAHALDITWAGANSLVVKSVVNFAETTELYREGSQLVLLSVLQLAC